MLSIVCKIYGYLFARPFFLKLNILLYHLGLRGLGILNFQSEYLQGENLWLNKFLKEKIRPVIFDVGANVGLYSQSIFKTNSEAIVYAFEPHPNTYKKLVNNIKNQNFYPINMGIGFENNRLTLFDYNNKDGSEHASLYKSVISDLHKGIPVSHIVDITTIDNFVIKNNINQIDLLKIDTEGNEFNVLKGAERTLKEKRIKALQIEFNEMNIISKASFKDFWDLLTDYDFFRILPGGGLLPIKIYSPIMCEIYAFQNLFAILKRDYINIK
jgi:hypothetical protein